MNKDFLNELIHSIRTPLSVIHNDLTYIGDRHPELEADRTLRNAEKIAAMLSLIEEIAAITESVGVVQVLEKIGDWRRILVTGGSNGTKVLELTTGDSVVHESCGLSEFYRNVLKRKRFEISLLEEKMSELSLRVVIDKNSLSIFRN